MQTCHSSYPNLRSLGSCACIRTKLIIAAVDNLTFPTINSLIISSNELLPAVTLTMSKPSVVIVHGACHVPEHFDDLTSVLRGAGYRVVVPPLPSTDLNPAVLSMDPDIQVVRKSIRAELDDGQDVVVFAHSYGGMPASSALPDLDRKSREELSLPGGVIGIVYCACMIPDKGSSTMDYRPGDAESLQTGKVQIVRLEWQGLVLSRLRIVD